MAQVEHQLDHWLEATRQLVADARFEEGDVLSLLDHWISLEALGQQLQEKYEDDQGPFDYRRVLEEPAYLDWAAERGLEAEPWLRKSMRIVTMIMRGAMTQVFSDNNARAEQQRRALDAQCEEVGEEMCARMKQTMESSIALMKRAEQGWASLPQPTEDEQALLEQYDEQLQSVLSGVERTSPGG
jgi:hypothetical protein